MNLDQLYQEFTDKLLPKIQEGLVITRDYFVDLFGRYVDYLIIRDSVFTALGLIGLIVTLVASYKLIRYGIKNDWKDECMLLLFFIFPIVGFSCIFFLNGENLIKDLYIPEVRILQEIQSYSK